MLDYSFTSVSGGLHAHAVDGFSDWVFRMLEEVDEFKVGKVNVILWSLLKQ